MYICIRNIPPLLQALNIRSSRVRAHGDADIVLHTECVFIPHYVYIYVLFVLLTLLLLVLLMIIYIYIYVYIYIYTYIHTYYYYYWRDTGVG